MTEIKTIDLQLMGSTGVVASFLLLGQNQEHAIIDTGPGSTIENLIAGLKNNNTDPESVRHVLLTHIHLDHAGAAGEFARRFGAKIYVHKNGANHMLRPERLMESASRIYGEMMQPLWGTFEPVPAEQLIVLEGHEELNIGGHNVRALYTPGHAIHHISYAINENIFTGDVGGVRLQNSKYALVPTPPPDIDLELWRQSLKILGAQEADNFYLAHFGKIENAAEHLELLHQNLNVLEQESLAAMRAGEGKEGIAARLKTNAEKVLSQESDSGLAMRYELATPYAMAAAGLERYWTKKKPEALG